MILGSEEGLTTGSVLLADPTAEDFVSRLENAARIVMWTKYGTASGRLDPLEAYFNREGRGPVKHGPPNAKGLYDMTGGMWEWCADVYAKGAYTSLSLINPSNAPKDPKDRSSRVPRGGSWRDSDPVSLHVACRISYCPDYDDYDVGGRLAAAPAQDSKAV